MNDQNNLVGDDLDNAVPFDQQQVQTSVEQTVAPQQPAAPAQAPVEQTVAPQQPAAPAQAPVEQTVAPQQPAAPAQAPVEQTVAPQQPAAPAQTPVEQTVAPQQPVQDQLEEGVQQQSHPVPNTMEQTFEQTMQMHPVQNKAEQNNQNNQNIQPGAVVQPDTVIDPLQGLVNQEGSQPSQPQPQPVQQPMHNTQQLAVIDPIQGIVNQSEPQQDPMQQIQNNQVQPMQNDINQGMMQQGQMQPMQNGINQGMMQQGQVPPMQNGINQGMMQQGQVPPMQNDINQGMMQQGQVPPMQNGINQGMMQQGQMQPMQNGMNQLMPQPTERIPGEDDDIINIKESKGGKIFSIITVIVFIMILAKIFFFSPKWIENAVMKSYACINKNDSTWVCTLELDSGTSYSIDTQNRLAAIVLENYSDSVRVDLYCEKAIIGNNKVLEYKLFLKEDGKEITNDVKSENELRELLGLQTEGNHTEELTLLEIGDVRIGLEDNQSYNYIDYTFKNENNIEMKMEYKSQTKLSENPLNLEIGNKYSVTYNVGKDNFDDYVYSLIRAE